MSRFVRSLLPMLMCLLAIFAAGSSFAEEVLFFGNSFTSVNDIPSMVEAIAVSKGKMAQTTRVTKGGQGWPYHLAQPATDEALSSKAWDWVVLQDQSLNATRLRSQKGDFHETGLQFYQRIVEKAPKANLLLYQTWAYSARHGIFSVKDGKEAAFANPKAMLGEIRKSYGDLQQALQAKDPRRQVLTAPVGEAFANCVQQHPEVSLFAGDHKHQNAAGSYLAALVIYAVIFQDNPVGAAPGKNVDPQQAKILQQVAQDTVKPSSR